MSNWWEAQDQSGQAAAWSWEAGADQGGAAGQDGWGGDQGKTGQEESWGQQDGAAQQDNSWGGGGAQDNAGWGGGGGAQDNAWGGQDNAWDKPSAKEYWETQEWNKSAGTLARKEEWQLEQDDWGLFQSDRNMAGINFDAYANVPCEVAGRLSENVPRCETFSDIYTLFSAYIPDSLQGNLERCGYQTPTPVQRSAIPCGLAGRDIMVCAQTGSGKTAAFLIPVLGNLMREQSDRIPIGLLDTPFEGPCKPHSLILTPTRELCVQIYEEALKMCHRTPYRVCRVYGGEKVRDQLPLLAPGCDVLVASPGRLKDFINREVIKLDGCFQLVLDEADRMLDMGFSHDIKEIVGDYGMPSKEDRQTMMFSATFPESCQQMAQEYLDDYMWIAVGMVGAAVETVDQVLEKVPAAKKFEKLIEIIDNFHEARQELQNNPRMLIFCNAKDTCRWLDEQLWDKSIDTGALHGDLDQTQREENLARFRKGEIEVLIATDVASRGLDIPNVTLVVNYDFPKDRDSYVHRIGRTGRIGNQGKAISFLAMDDDCGACFENIQILLDLCTVLKNSNKEVPEWLQTLADGGSNGGAGGSWDGWKGWGGRDVRAGDNEWSQQTWGGGEKKAEDTWDTWGQEKAGGDNQQAADASAGNQGAAASWDNNWESKHGEEGKTWGEEQAWQGQGW